MSSDYYLVCPSKKIYMPIGSMHLTRTSIVEGNWLGDFILECGGEPVSLEFEQSPLMDQIDDEEEQGIKWQFMNAWHSYPK